MVELERRLGPLRAAAVMLNIVLGAGLLTLPGLAVEVAGSNALAVWGACALAAAPLLAVFALLGRRYPDAGGLAHIAKAAFGDAGYVVATLLFLGAVAFGLPAIALTGGHYASALAGGPPHVWAAGLLAFAVLANVISAEGAARFNALAAGVLLLCLVAIAVVGLVLTMPNMGEGLGAHSQAMGVRDFAGAFMMVFFAFTGWEVASSLGGEVRRPERNIPLAMAVSFVLAVALYGLLAVVAQSAVLDGNYAAPFAALFGASFGLAGTAAISIMAVLLILANLSAAVWAVSRMVWSAAGEGLLHRGLRRLRGGVPATSVVLTVSILLGVLGMSAAGWLRLDALFAAAGQNFILLYGIAAAALLVLATTAWERALAVSCLVLVAFLVVIRGGQGAAYPLLLIVSGAVIAVMRYGRAVPGSGREQ